MARLIRSIQISAPIEAVFDFHADPRNLEKLASAQARAQLLMPCDIPLHRGSRVRLRVMIMGLLPQHVESEIVVFDRPHEFTDQQRSGPFRAWRHRHLFREVDGGTELTDDLSYELPTGLPFRLIGAATMAAQIEALFAYRQQRTKEILGGAGRLGD